MKNSLSKWLVAMTVLATLLGSASANAEYGTSAQFGGLPLGHAGTSARASAGTNRFSDDPVNIGIADPDDDALRGRVGAGSAPLFESHGVIRTGGINHDSTYFVLGYDYGDLLTEDRIAPLDEPRSDFSYGIGVGDSESNFEYMMSVDHGDFQTRTVGINFISRF